MRYTSPSIHEAVDKVMKAIVAPKFELGKVTEACGSAMYACEKGFEEKLRGIYNYGQEFGSAVVCLRLAVRVGAIAKKIEDGGEKSLAVALAPYAIVEGNPTSRYQDVDLFFKREGELTEEVAALYLRKSEIVFNGSVKHYVKFIKIIESLAVHSRARLCSAIFACVVKGDDPHKLIEIVEHLPEWKDELKTVLFEEKANLSWLRQKGMLQKLKIALPELAILILEKEEEFLRLERKIVEHESAIKTAIYNDLLMDAQAAWIKNQAQAEAPEVKEGKEVVAEEKAEQETLPEEFFCPITQELLKDPVITEAGIIYERAAIELWLKDHDTDPYTRMVLVKKTLIPVIAFKSLIEKAIKARQK